MDVRIPRQRGHRRGLLALLLLASAGACGDSLATSPRAADAAPDAVATADAAAITEASVPDASQPSDAVATGSQLVAGDARFEGLTSDGFVVFSEPTPSGGRVAKVIATDGTGEATIAEGMDAEKTIRVLTAGPVAFVWTDRGDRMATLTVWSKATGALAIGSGIRPGLGAATPDGAFIAYVSDVTSTQANVVTGSIGAATPSVVGVLNASDSDCWRDATVSFAGGATPRLLSLLRRRHHRAHHSQHRPRWERGSRSVVHSARRDPREHRGGHPGRHRLACRHRPRRHRDGHAGALGVGLCPLARRDGALLSRARRQYLRHPHQPSGAGRGRPCRTGAEPRGGVPDHRFALFGTMVADGGIAAYAGDTDVRVNLPDGGPPLSLVATPTSCTSCLDDSFTPDSTFALAVDPMDNGTDAGSSGPLRAFPLDGGTSVTFGTRVWDTLALGTGSGAGSRFLFVETYADATLANGYAYDFYTRALSDSALPPVIARHAEWLGVDHARTMVAYSIPGDGALSGVWLAPLQ